MNTSNPFGGQQQSGASNPFGGQQQSGASSTFGVQQSGFSPATSSGSAVAFQMLQQPFQFGQPSSFGQGSGASGQPSSFGQGIGGPGQNPSFGQGGSAPGQTSLFGQGGGVPGQTLGFGQGSRNSGQTSLFGQSSGTSGQTSFFGQVSGASGQISGFGQGGVAPELTSGFGQGSGATGRTSGFGQDSGATGQTSGFGQGSGATGQTSGFGQGSGATGQTSGLFQGSGPPAKGPSFGQSPSVQGRSTLFGPSSGGPGQTPSFGHSIGTDGRQDSSPSVQTTSTFGQDSGGSAQSLGFSQSSALSQASSSKTTLGFGQSSAFGQPPVFTQASGIRQVTPLGTTTVAPSNSSSSGNQGFTFKPSVSVTTFPTPTTIRKTSGASSEVPEFMFKPPENATFKPIFGAVPELDNSQAQITPKSFTFSKPASSAPAVLTAVSFSSPSGSASTNTGSALGFSKPAASGNLPPTFAFALPSRKDEEETLGPKPPFGGFGSSFTSVSSSSSGLASSVQAFQTIQSGKQESDEGAAVTDPPRGFVKGLKRKDEPDCSPRRLEYDIPENPEPAPKDHPPEKRPLRITRPGGEGSKLFGRVLKDVLKSNELTGHLREVKGEDVSPESRDLQLPGTSQGMRGPPRPATEEQQPMLARTKKGRRRDSTGKPPLGQIRRRSSSADSIGGLSPSELTAIQIKDIPDHLNHHNVLRKRFQCHGKVIRILCKPKKKVATVYFKDHASAEVAQREAQGWIPGIRIFWLKKKISPAKKHLSSAVNTGMVKEGSPARGAAEEQRYTQLSPKRTASVQSSVGASSILLTKGSSVKKSSSAKSLIFEADSFDSGSDGHSSDSVASSLPPSLSHLMGTLGESAEERYRLLDQRDRILRQARVKRTELGRAQVFVGTCPDMCPEKERYMRETRNQLSIYELILGTDKVDHAAAVKEYSRSSADQEEPLPHELRPTPVLSMTMDYLVTQIMDRGEGNYREWYDFVWNRTRAIRKDITQQHLCDPATASLIEKCMRFHIHCAHHLCEEPRSAFEAKINLENTTKCLQSLKEMYQDLANKGTRCAHEAEFRGYSVLLNLNKGDILREVQQFQPDVRNSPEVSFAVQAFAAFNNTNFVRFFRLVKSATYLSGCILHSYFSQIRRDALRSLNVAYTSTQRATIFPVESVVRMLLFRDCDEATEFLASYGLSVSDGFVELNRLSFSEPESSLKPRKCVFIGQKRVVSVGEVVNGGPLPHPPHHVPVCSFSSQNKYIGDGPAAEPLGASPRGGLEVAGGQREEKSLRPEVPLVKVHPQLLPAPPPAPQPVPPPASTVPPAFAIQQPLVRPLLQPEPPSAFAVQTPLVRPVVHPEPPKSSEFTFQQPLVQPAMPPEPPKASGFTFQQSLVRPVVQPEQSSAFTVQPLLGQSAVLSEAPKASEFTFQQPLVRPMVQPEPLVFTVQPPLVQPAVLSEPPKASEFTFQQPLVRPTVQSELPKASEFTFQQPLVRPIGQLEPPKASEFTFQQPPVRPAVQLEPQKASEFTFQQPLVRPELSSAFPVQPPLVRPMVQTDLPATSAFTMPQSLVRPTVHSEPLQPVLPASATSFTMNPPLRQPKPLPPPPPPPPPPKPVYTDQHISEVVEELVEESLKEHCKVLSEAGAAYASTALSVSSTTAEELLASVAAELLNGAATEEMMAEKRRVEEEKRRVEEEKRRVEEEKRRVEEEKRKAEEARLKLERERLIEQLSLEICSELAEEVVKESTAQTSSSELKAAINEDRRARIARCSQQVSHHCTDLFLEEEIFQTAKEALQELQCYCKYLQRWREVVVARKKLRRQMRAFPAAPCCVDRRDKLKALIPSAVSPPDRDLLAKGILQLGHAGNLGVSYTRLQWLKEQTMHQMKLQYFHQQLLCEAAWTPLDLPSLIAKNLPAYHERIFWKVVLVLPNSEDNPNEGCSRLLAEWLKAKFLDVEESRHPASDVENRIQTLTVYKALRLHGERSVWVNVCVKVALGTLSDTELDQVETQKDLLGTSGLVLLLPAAVSSQDVAEDDVYWLSAVLQLKQLLQAKPFHPIVPLVILVPSQEELSQCREEEVEEGLMLQDLMSAKLISEYIIVQIPESINDLQGSNQVSQAVQWLVSRTPSASELCCQTLLQFIEDGVCQEFNIPFHHDRAERHRAGLPSQEPSAIVELYNGVLLFLAEVVSSEQLSELSWPVTEFSEPGGSPALPHLQWNTPEHLTWLKKAVLSFQIPHMDLPPLGAPWRPVCSMIFQYVSQIPSSLLTQPILESQVQNLLRRTYARWRGREFACPGEDGPSVQDIPWDDLFVLCVEHRLRDWKPPRLPVLSEALSEDGHVGVYFFKEDLKKFVQPLSWEQARLNTLREIQEKELESELVSQSQVLSLRRRTSMSASEAQDVSTDTISLKEPRTPHELDITYVPSREELLPERLSLSLRAEKEESQRFQEQLHRWLAEDTAGYSEDFSFPLYIPQTLVSTPESIHPLGRLSTPSRAQAGSPIGNTGSVPEPSISLSDRLKQLRKLIQNSREQDVACELHLSTLLDVLDN